MKSRRLEEEVWRWRVLALTAITGLMFAVALLALRTL